MQWSESHTDEDNEAERGFTAKKGFRGPKRGTRGGKRVSGTNTTPMYTSLGKVLSWGSWASPLPPSGLLLSLGHSYPVGGVH